MMKRFIGKKEKWTNKVTVKQYVADYLLHNTTCHTQPLIILSQVVAEKSLMEDIQMHNIGVRDGKIEKLKKKEK